MKKAILFDLDATLIQFNQKQFEHEYFTKLLKKIEPLGINIAEFEKVLWSAVKNMYANNGEKTNEQVFWDTLNIKYSNQSSKLKETFDDYYSNEYNSIQKIVKQNQYVKQIVKYCQQNFEYVILATNPFFPHFAVASRLEWVGLSMNDFDYVTTYEIAHYSKPNPKFFEEVLDKFALNPSDCIMVGNNEAEDYMPATSIGIESYLTGEFVMPCDKLSNHAPIIDLKDLINVLEQAKNH